MNENDTKYNEACQAYEEKNYDKAYELFYDLALDSDISCQMNVANMLKHGLGVEQNLDRAKEWYEQAAINEDKQGQYIHAWNCIQDGKEEEASKYLRLSADAGFLDATYDLAGFCAHGLHGVEADASQAASLYEAAVLLGKKEAIGPLFTSKKDEVGLIKAFIYMIKNSSSFTKCVNSKA